MSESYNVILVTRDIGDYREVTETTTQLCVMVDKQLAIEYAFNYVENSRVKQNDELQRLVDDTKCELNETLNMVVEDYAPKLMSASDFHNIRELRRMSEQGNIYMFEASMKNKTTAVSDIPAICPNNCHSAHYVATIDYYGHDWTVVDPYDPLTGMSIGGYQLINCYCCVIDNNVTVDN